MAPAEKRSPLERALVWLLALAALLAVATAALSFYTQRRLARAESRFLGLLEERVVQPARSSEESFEHTDRFLAAAVEVSEAWPTVKTAFDDPASRVPDELAARIEALLTAADLPLAHEMLLAGDEQGLEVLRAARLLDRAVGDAARRGDEERQLRCAEALAAIADGFYRRTSLIGLLLGTAVEQMELDAVRRLLEAPDTSAAVLDRLSALLDRPRLPLQASWASEALEVLRFEPPTDTRHWAVAWLAPLQNAVDDLVKARTLERFGALSGELDRPIVEMLAAEPVWTSRGGPLDVIANIILPNTRDAFIKVKTLEEVRRLGREAIRRRRDGEPCELARPEVLAALDGYWNVQPGRPLPPGPARTRALLTWRVPG